jgi:hypothetical protein
MPDAIKNSLERKNHSGKKGGSRRIHIPAGFTIMRSVLWGIPHFGTGSRKSIMKDLTVSFLPSAPVIVKEMNYGSCFLNGGKAHGGGGMVCPV